ncbi:hypothetical protein CROQUDRAFT_652026 [Cronartium quercuum f. sp. fusiforme G11]|uniref:Uncharacterized protein n=1 Tax=Cronartium quercuum f. sp. fusiforme G11 TaxID=708437 RepID=A0A9P6NRQ8_9BASI|nr:hypothetical protein CROQUDRAFT_652026 [Cronartium quercuum f. sp. fusiforme G11]
MEPHLISYIRLISALLSSDRIVLSELESDFSILLTLLELNLIPTLLNTFYHSTFTQSNKPKLECLHIAQSIHRASHSALLARLKLITTSYRSPCRARYHLRQFIQRLQIVPHSDRPSVLVFNLAIQSGLCTAAITLHHFQPQNVLQAHFIHRLSVLLQHVRTLDQPSNQIENERWAIVWTVSQVLAPMSSIKLLREERALNLNLQLLIEILSSTFQEILTHNQPFQDLHLDLSLPSVKLIIPSSTATRLSQPAHPLANILGPFSITFGNILEISKDSLALPALTNLFNLLNETESMWSRATGKIRLKPFGPTTSAGPEEAADEASKSLLFASLAVLAGLINAWSDTLAPLILGCWSRLYFLVSRLGPGGSESSLKVWEAIEVRLKTLKPDKALEIVRSLEPWNESKETWLRTVRVTVYYTVLEVVVGKVSDTYLSIDLLNHLWEDLETAEEDYELVESAHGVLISIFVHQRSVDDVTKLTERYVNLLLKDTKLSDSQIRQALKTMTQNVTPSISWKTIIEPISNQLDQILAIERLIELVDSIHSSKLINLCELIKIRLLGLKGQDQSFKDKLIQDWFNVLANSNQIDQVRKMIGFKWWLLNLTGGTFKHFPHEPVIARL